ncbi:MAG: heavy metal translocating P-type ATPase [Candidatus Saccharibacteria bacterium]
MNKALTIEDEVYNQKLQLIGLDCPDCAAKVEKAVKKVPGVINAQVVYPAGRLNVQMNSASGLPLVIEKVHSMGYQAVDEAKTSQGQQTTSILVHGLDCADCAAKLEKSINNISGVQSAAVNFGASRLKVTHDTDVAEILTAVRKMGYVGELEESGAKQNMSFAWWKTNQYVIPTAVSGIVLLLALASRLFGASHIIFQSILVFGIVLAGYLPAKNGISVLINARELDMNILMTVAVLGATVIGQMEEAAAVIFLFSLGNLLQGYTLDRTRQSIRTLIQLAPQEALVRRSGLETVMPVSSIQTGDIIIVRPGERIAMDGRVIAGSSAVNQAPITGESMPVDKVPGNEVFAGTINEQGSLEIEVTRLAEDNTLSRIIKLVEEAQEQKAPSQQFIDRFARYYTPAVIFAALLVAVLPPVLLDQPFKKWFYEAMAMLLVACPCALVISTPVSIVAAIGSAAKRGVLIKGGAYLEEAGSVAVVAFDKTGTLTSGKPQVTDVIPFNGFGEATLISIAAALEARSEHPLAQAVTGYARHRGILALPADDFQSIPGKGASGQIGGKSYIVGNDKLFQEQNITLDMAQSTMSSLLQQGKSVVLVGSDSQLLGIIAMTDVLRPESQAAVQSLKKAGVKRVIMLTGDNPKTAASIAQVAGVDEYRAGLLPEDKVDAVKQLLKEHGKVAMVGDGVNDAPALAISTVGIAMGAAGTDTALETADIALMADDLGKLSYMISLGRKTMSIIKQNIFLALLIKGVILLMVIPGWLTLWLAVIGDMGASLLVTLNGMRLMGMPRK